MNIVVYFGSYRFAKIENVLELNLEKPKLKNTSRMFEPENR